MLQHDEVKDIQLLNIDCVDGSKSTRSYVF